MLRVHQLRSDQRTVSVHACSGGVISTNTRDASPTSTVVPMQMLSFDLKNAGSAILSGSSQRARTTSTSAEGPRSAVDKAAGAAAHPAADEAPAEPQPGSAADAVPGSSVPEHLATQGAHQIELIIDSLPRHQLIETIPVTVDALGDKVFTATIGILNLSGTGNTLGEALLAVKEQVDILYDTLMNASDPSEDEKLYLKYLQSRIVGPSFADSNRARNTPAMSPAAATPKPKKFSWR
jgi:hypothetical protein